MPSKSPTAKVDKKQWYLAILIVRDRVEDHQITSTCDEQTRLIHARSAEKAYKKAYKLGKAQETVYLNNAGEMVYREFVGLHDLSVIQGALTDGVEIKSRVFSHAKPQELVHTQDELTVFGTPLRGEWQLIGEALPIRDAD